MALQMGEVEVKIKANVDDAKAELSSLEDRDVSVSATIEVDTSELDSLQNDDSFSVTVSAKADTTQAEASITEVEKDEYNAEIDTDADTLEAEKNIATVETDEYNATIDTDADTSVAEADISTVENDDYNAEIDAGANTTLAEASIADVEEDDYNATVKADADTEEANEKLDEAAKERTVKLKAVLSGIGDVYKELYELATGAAKYGDDVMTAAAEMGITNKQYQELLYTEGLGDVSIGEWESMYKTFFNQYSSGNKDFLAGLETLKINPEDYNGDYFSMMLDTISALDEYNGKDKEDIFGQIFNGRTLETANKLVGNMSKFKELWTEANETGFVKSDEELGTMGSLADELDRLSAAWLSLKTELGTNLAPALTNILEQITPLVQEITAIFEDGEVSDEEAQNLGTKLSTAFTDSLEKALGVGGTVLTTLANALPEVINGIDWSTLISSTVSSLGTAVTTILTETDWTGTFTSICQGLGKAISEMDWSALLTNIATTLGDIVLSTLGSLVSGFKAWLDGDNEGLEGDEFNEGKWGNAGETAYAIPAHWVEGKGPMTDAQYEAYLHTVYDDKGGAGREGMSGETLPTGKGGTTVNDPGKISNGEMSTFEVTIDDKGDPLLVETTNDKTDELIDGVAAVGDELSETPAPELKVTNNVTVNCNGTEASASTSTTSEVGKYNQSKADGKSFSNGAGRGK